MANNKNPNEPHESEVLLEVVINRIARCQEEMQAMIALGYAVDAKKKLDMLMELKDLKREMDDVCDLHGYYH